MKWVYKKVIIYRISDNQNTVFSNKNKSDHSKNNKKNIISWLIFLNFYRKL